MAMEELFRLYFLIELVHGGTAFRHLSICWTFCPISSVLPEMSH